MKITPYRIKKGLRYLFHYGPKEFWVRLRERMEPEEVPYSAWYEEHRAAKEALRLQRQESDGWEERPLFSVCVPLYHTPERQLREMIASVQAQSYTNWQLCLADGSEDDSLEKIMESYRGDTRIGYLHLAENLGIAENTNAAFSLAGGVWIGLLDHDDVLAPDALYEVLKRAKECGADIVYTDEDKTDEQGKEHFQPHFKPDFNLDLLRSNNYITHFFAVKREIVKKVGGFLKEYDGAQDYDFIFRCVEESSRVAHVPRLLYHWRMSEQSTADNPASKEYAFEAGKRAITDHLKRQGIEAEVSQTLDWGFYRVHYPLKGMPLVSILIPNKDEVGTLQKCLEAIAQSSYSHYEVIIIENNSTQKETFSYYEKLSGQPYNRDLVLEGRLCGGAPVRIVTWQSYFNYSAINNFGVKYARGEYLVLLNNDVEIKSPGWMEEMLGNMARPEVGIVGAKLLYPDGTIQHAGIVLGIGGVAGNLFAGMKAVRSGYMHKASIQLNYSAVTAACLMVKKAVYEQVGGLTEELEVAFNDVDFCLKVGKAGFLVVYDPWVEGIHHESKSRGAEDSDEKLARFDREIAYMKTHWPKILTAGDPYYNPNLSLKKCNYALRPLLKR